MGADTTIGVSRRTWERLGRRKRAGESYDDIIARLLDETSPQQREPLTDGGERDLLMDVGARRVRPGAPDVFVGRLLNEFSDQELEWLSEKNPVGETAREWDQITETKSSGLDMVVQFGGIEFPDGREDRRVFLRGAAEAALERYGSGSPVGQPDGGRVARQPSFVGRVRRNPVLAALFVAVVVLPLLGGSRDD